MSTTKLTTEKVMRETGLEYVFASLNLLTPFGQKLLRSRAPYLPGQEEDLRQEFARVAAVGDILEQDETRAGRLKEILMLVKDNTLSIERSAGGVLSVVELFELKNLLLQMEKLRKMDEIVHFPPEYVPYDVTPLLDRLDPDGSRISTFFIYDSFSEELALLRGRRKTLERKGRKLQKEKAAGLKKEHGIVLTPKFDIQVSKADTDRVKMIEGIPGLEKAGEDYMTITWRLAPDEETDQIVRQTQDLTDQIEREEYRIRRWLSAHVGGHRKALLQACQAIGELDLAIARADYAREHHCCIPEIIPEHEISFTDGRHLEVEAILAKDGGAYCPISIGLKDGVTCITGANMGGKTISLKLVGMITLMAQHGIPVPCRKARIGLSGTVRILIGDTQSVQRGLSSFGSEMEDLRTMLEESQARALLLIDEIASGTNPSEGLALTRALVEHLQEKPYITLLTTHFERVAEREDVVNLQVTGLGSADLSELDTRLKAADAKGRIEVIRQFMDYRLRKVSGREDVPRDALHIARMLGVDPDIIEKAKEYLN